MITKTAPHGTGTMVSARSGLSGNVSSRIIPMPEGDLLAACARHKEGALAQNAFVGLSADDREFLMTGITPEEWDSAFA